MTNFYNIVLRRLLPLFLFASMVTLQAAGQRLFHISRSLNSNIVCYDVQLNGKGLNTANPVKAYWIDSKIPNDVPSDLKYIERKMAYGINVKSCTATDAYVTLTASHKRSIHICQRGGRWVALMTVKGETCYLNEIYVKTKSVMGVDYVELRGTSVAKGTKLTERVNH